jgi:hypothetical protein
VVGRNDPPRREREEAGIKAAAAQVLGDGPDVVVPGLLEDRRPDPFDFLAPAAQLPGESVASGQPGAAVQRHLAHRRRIGKDPSRGPDLQMPW